MTGRHAGIPRTSHDYRESEARAERREAREEKRREYRVPMEHRETAREPHPDRVIYLGSEFQAHPSSIPRASIFATRYRHGIEIGGWGTVEQLREARDALTAHIRDRLEEHEDD